MFCAQCGKPRPENTEFCPQCGAVLTTATPATLAPSVDDIATSDSPVSSDDDIATSDSPVSSDDDIATSDCPVSSEDEAVAATDIPTSNVGGKPLCWMAVASLMLSVISAFFATIPISAIAILLGCLALRKSATTSGRSIAIAGIAIGAVLLVLTTIFLFAIAAR